MDRTTVAESALKMFDLFEHVTITFWTEDTTLLYMNELMRTWAGRPLEQMVGRKLADIFPEWAGETGSMIKRVLSERAHVVGVPYHDVPNPVTGKIEHWVSDHYHIVLADGRRVVGTRGRNVTEKVETERALERERRKLQDVVMAAPMAVALFEGPDHRLAMMNPTYESLYGGRVKLGMSPRFDVSPEDPETKKHVALVDEIWRTGEPFVAPEMPIAYDWKGTGKPEARVFHLVYQPVFDGDQVCGIALFGNDVSELVRSREQAQDMERAAASHRDSLFSILQSIPAACAVVKGSPENMVYELSNRTNTSWVQKGELTGRCIDEVFPEFEEQGFMELFRKVMRTGERLELQGVRVEHTTQSGERIERYIDSSIEPIRNIYGVVDRLLSFSVDITERHIVQKQLEDAKEKLQEAVRTRDEYMSIASHELRTPLTSIMLQAEMLRSSKLDDKTMAGVERMMRHGKRIEIMVATLLDVGRLSRGDFPMEFEDVDAKSVILDVIGRLKPDADRARSTIEFVADDDVVGHWDKVRLDQVMTNLLTNALKYGPGKPVFITLRRVGASAVVSVQDFGIGMSQDEMDHLFEQFHRVARNGVKGLGLGLWISDKIVRRFGGKMLVDSRPGEGSTFSVELPLGDECK